jgi:hypothetical protein
LQGLFGGHLLGRGAEGLGSGEDIEPEVAAAFGPFVVLLGQDGADEADVVTRRSRDPGGFMRRRRP